MSFFKCTDMHQLRQSNVRKLMLIKNTVPPPTKPYPLKEKPPTCFCVHEAQFVASALIASILPMDCHAARNERTGPIRFASLAFSPHAHNPSK